MSRPSETSMFHFKEIKCNIKIVMNKFKLTNINVFSKNCCFIFIQSFDLSAHSVVNRVEILSFGDERINFIESHVETKRSQKCE